MLESLKYPRGFFSSQKQIMDMCNAVGRKMRRSWCFVQENRVEGRPGNTHFNLKFNGLLNRPSIEQLLYCTVASASLLRDEDQQPPAPILPSQTSENSLQWT
jgi:hypothetical protein